MPAPTFWLNDDASLSFIGPVPAVFDAEFGLLFSAEHRYLDLTLTVTFHLSEGDVTYSMRGPGTERGTVRLERVED